MKNITVTNYKGEKFSGYWNGKTYSSKIDGRNDLHRIYVDNEPLHIDDAELKKLQSNDEIRQKKISTTKVEDFFSWLEEQPEETKKYMFLNALDMMAENSKRSKTGEAITSLRKYFNEMEG